MKYGAKEMAKALYAVTRELDEAASRAAIQRFAAETVRRYGPARLAKVLHLLPVAADEIDGRQKAVIETARELSPGLAKTAVAALGIDPNRTAITTVVRPELIGGIRVRLADRVFDATVRRRLDLFRRAVTQNE
ncbi:MAG: F0F1 ATP synthase subunit delta [Patescibacteria group bacterium]|nr:F0F1 ATP synthase subunit delta [Patescibacteria group bacterium]